MTAMPLGDHTPAEAAKRERVARAMWDVEQPNICGADSCCTWESIDEWRREVYLRLADAAIAAVAAQTEGGRQ